MSYLPREEQPLSTIYPDLDINSPLSINILPHNDEGVHESSGSYVGPEPGNATNLNANEKAACVSPEIKEAQEVPPNVPVKIGGTKNRPCIRRVVTNAVNSQQFDDTYAEVGFSNMRFSQQYYTRPDASLQAYQPFITSLASEKLDLMSQLISPAFKVEYDLDERDLTLLGLILVRFRKVFSAEEFEVIMSMLDACAAILLWRIAILESKNSGVITDASRGTLISVHSNGEENDHPCIICNSPDFNDSNSIVFCDGCDISVHQDCYGVPNIPEGFWFCKRCEALREHGDHLAIRCELCPLTSGAFKRTTSNKWVHMVCALYTPRIRVPKETGLLEPIYDLERVEPSRYSLRCYVCNEKRGACLQCTTRGCFKAFHASCARLAGFYMSTCDYDMSEMLQQQDFLPVYCDKHSINAKKMTPETSSDMILKDTSTTPSPPPLSVVDSPASDGIQRVRDTIKEEKAKLRLPRQSLFSVKRYYGVYWRTPKYNTLILPQAVVSPVQRALKARFNIDVEKPLIEFLCRYWTIKRDMREGVMFNKRLNLALEVGALRVLRPILPENTVESPENMLNLVEQLLDLTRSFSEKAKKAKSDISVTNSKPSKRLVKSPEKSFRARPLRSSRRKAVLEPLSQSPQPTARNRGARNAPEYKKPQKTIRKEHNRTKITKDYTKVPETIVAEDRKSLKRARTPATYVLPALSKRFKDNDGLAQVSKYPRRSNAREKPKQRQLVETPGDISVGKSTSRRNSTPTSAPQARSSSKAVPHKLPLRSYPTSRVVRAARSSRSGIKYK